VKKRLTLVIILDDEAMGNDVTDIAPLSNKTNEEWAEEMRSTYGQDPGMTLESVKVEDFV
jgi:hypothetical protein